MSDTQDRNELALELLREWVRVNVMRWAIESRIEKELAGGGEMELNFLPPDSVLYENHVADASVACPAPEDVYRLIVQEHANRFLAAVDAEAEEYRKAQTRELAKEMKSRARTHRLLKAEIRDLSTREVRVAITLGQNNLSSVKPEFQADLEARLDLLRAELKRRVAK